MKLNKKFISIKLLIVLICCSQSGCDLIFDRFEYKIFDKSYINNLHHNVIRFNRSMYYLNLEFDVEKPIDNHISIVFDAHAETGNEYRKIFTSRAKPFCNFTQHDTEFYAALGKVSNLPPLGTCPIPSEHYVIKRFPLTKLRSAAIFNSHNDWKLFGRISKNNRRMATFTALFKVDKYQ